MDWTSPEVVAALVGVAGVALAKYADSTAASRQRREEALDREIRLREAAEQRAQAESQDREEAEQRADAERGLRRTAEAALDERQDEITTLKRQIALLQIRNDSLATRAQIGRGLALQIPQERARYERELAELRVKIARLEMDPPEQASGVHVGCRETELQLRRDIVDLQRRNAQLFERAGHGDRETGEIEPVGGG